MQKKWTPEAEEAFNEGLKMGLDNVGDKGWAVIGLIAASISGFIVGVVVGIITA